MAAAAKKERKAEEEKKEWQSGLQKDAGGEEKATEIFIGNITAWGPQAKEFFRDHSAEVVGLIENHVKKDEVKNLAGWFRKRGRRTIATPARQSDKSEKGSGGGVSWHQKSHLAESKVAAAEAMAPTDWAPIWLNLDGAAFVLVLAYFLDSIGLGGGNTARMLQIASFVTGLEVPWAVVADWNFNPEVLQASGWPRKLEAEVLQTARKAQTCSAGQGQTFDYALISKSFRPLVRGFAAVRQVPWAPHVGLRLLLHPSPRAILTRSLVKPKVPLIPKEAYEKRKAKQKQRRRRRRHRGQRSRQIRRHGVAGGCRLAGGA